jgi:hypothetical protein
VTDELRGGFDFGDSQVAAEREFTFEAFEGELIGEAFTKVFERVDDLMRSDERQDAAVELGVGAGNDTLSAELAKQRRADDGSFARFVADGTDGEIAVGGAGFEQFLLDGSIESHSLGGIGGGGFNALCLTVNREDLNVAGVQGTHEAHAESA